MNIFFRFFIVLGVLSVTACASPSGSENTASAAADENGGVEQLADNAQTGNDKEELICRREVVTGTNFRREVCRSRAELEESSRQAQDLLDYQRDQVGGTGPGN